MFSRLHGVFSLWIKFRMPALTHLPKVRRNRLTLGSAVCISRRCYKFEHRMYQSFRYQIVCLMERKVSGSSSSIEGGTEPKHKPFASPYAPLQSEQQVPVNARQNGLHSKYAWDGYSPCKRGCSAEGGCMLWCTVCFCHDTAGASRWLPCIHIT